MNQATTNGETTGGVPARATFLNLLGRDIEAHPDRLQAVDAVHAGGLEPRSGAIPRGCRADGGAGHAPAGRGVASIVPGRAGAARESPIERVVLLADGVDIVWREVGWKELAGELAPETLGGEMLEAEGAQ